jgi:hypothetical protein
LLLLLLLLQGRHLQLGQLLKMLTQAHGLLLQLLLSSPKPHALLQQLASQLCCGKVCQCTTSCSCTPCRC